MNKQLVRVFAVLVSGLAVVGLFSESHLLEIMNVDMTLDILRVGLAGLLVYAGFFSNSEKVVNMSLTVLGVLYLGMGILGLIDRTLFGLLPAGLTGFDIVFHLGAGALATWAGLHKSATKTTSSSS